MKHAILPVTQLQMDPVFVPLTEEVDRSGAGRSAFVFQAFRDEEDDERTDPWAEGACRLDLTREEWRVVRGAALLSFLMVASADGKVHAWERRAMVRALEDGKRSSCEVFRLVCAELFRKRDGLLEQLVSDSLGFEHLPEAYHVVQRRLGRHEAERFKWCLLELGRRVAVASGGMFASWGWLRREERHALAELALVLDVGGNAARGMEQFAR
ncbi:MAG TPA: hypothetical protein VF794_04205 [Archangium sp.]|jgi:hypothetical protein|uniref:hypothetical protein n=1 Tax=Archangium sp. TaxID=1872627 RepID=UPI002ED98E8F